MFNPKRAKNVILILPEAQHSQFTNCGICKKEEIKMKKILKMYGSCIAALALFITTLTVNSTCVWTTYQSNVPEEAKKLRKF